MKTVRYALTVFFTYAMGMSPMMMIHSILGMEWATIQSGAASAAPKKNRRHISHGGHATIAVGHWEVTERRGL